MTGSGAAAWLRRWSLRTLAAAGLLALLVTFTPLVAWWCRALAGPWNDPPGEVLIVLTGSTVDQMIGVNSYWRAAYAARFFKQDGFEEIIVSGGGTPPAAGPMRDFLVAQGIPPDAIRLETEAVSTHESALRVAALLRREPDRYRNRRLVLLTSDYHMFRASRAFKKAGLDVRPRPFPDAGKRASTWAGRWPAFLDLAEETTKIVYYYLRGWI